MVALAGVGFAVVLMFTELGFRNALFDSTIQILEKLNADLILASTAHKGLVSFERFDKQRIYQARSCPGVAGAYPFYMHFYGVLWKARDTALHPIRLLAFPLSDPVLAIPEVAEHAEQLSESGTALFDLRSKPLFGLPDPREPVANQPGFEICNRRVRLVGTFELGTDFLSDGNLILSDDNFATYCATRVPGGDPLSIVDLGVVQLAEGASVDQVRQALARLLPGDVRVYTKQEFIDREIEFWNNSTPVGYVFFLGMVIGFLVGVVVCYQIISADISDHIPEFATLKAMGYRNRYFMGFVLQEAILLSVLSFIPGLLVSLGLYAVLAKGTGLLMVLNVPRATEVFVLTAVMCLASGCLAMRKVLAADPADLF
jgi:putative ABC transport system permease protein